MVIPGEGNAAYGDLEIFFDLVFVFIASCPVGADPAASVGVALALLFEVVVECFFGVDFGGVLPLKIESALKEAVLNLL